MSNFFIQIIRTLVPIIVGWIVGKLARLGFHLPPGTDVELIYAVSTLAASLYYVGVAWLERKWSWFGWLLGIARNPVYASTAKHVEQ